MNNLPTELYVKPTDIDEEWDEMDDDEREEVMSDYLSDTYGFCHKGFRYKTDSEQIHITNIEWDEEEC